MPRPQKTAAPLPQVPTRKPSYWTIVDGKSSLAQARLDLTLKELKQPSAGTSLNGTSHPPTTHPDRLLVSEILDAYLREHASRSPSRQWITHMVTPLAEWWAGKAVAKDQKSADVRAIHRLAHGSAASTLQGAQGDQRPDPSP